MVDGHPSVDECLLLTMVSSLLLWVQEEAYEDSQKYKVGKFILEKGRIYREGW